MIAPTTNPHTGALIWKNDTCDNAIKNAKSALKRYLLSEKPCCKLEIRTPIKAKPASIDTNASGNDWIKGTIFHAKTPKNNVNTPDTTAAI